jgi:putative sigma-54 modulation protein
MNGPKGGEDKRCRLVANLLRSGVVTVEDRGSELTAVIDRASDRLARGIQRTLERKRAAVGSRDSETGRIPNQDSERASENGKP